MSDFVPGPDAEETDAGPVTIYDVQPDESSRSRGVMRQKNRFLYDERIGEHRIARPRAKRIRRNFGE